MPKRRSELAISRCIELAIVQAQNDHTYDPLTLPAD